MAAGKRLPPGSQWEHLDTDGDGIITDEEIAMEERMIELQDMRSDMENEDKKQDAQRNMAWFALFGMLLYPAIILITTLAGQDKAAQLISDIAPTYFVSISVLVAAFFGADAIKKK